MNTVGIVIGGVIPAVFLGLGTVLMRASIGAGATIPMYLAVVGTTIAGIGWAAVLIDADGAATMKGACLPASWG